jgi:PAS domain S-box-containing protein
MSDLVFKYEASRRALDAHSIVSVTDVKGNILHVNELFCKISMYSRAELVGKNHRVIKSDEHPPEVFRQMWRTIAKGEIWHGEMKNKRKDGGFYWVKTTIMPVLNHAGKPYQYTSIRTDITDRKLAELELLRSREKLKTALQVKSDFLSRMNHELRTPLNGIIGLRDVLEETDLDVVQKELVTEIKHSADALLKILVDLLDFEKASSGHITLENINMNVVDYAAEVELKWRRVAKAQGVEFVCGVGENLPNILKFDPNQMKKIIDVLLNNAFKFTKSGKVGLCIRLGCENTIITEVTDTGIGIPEDAVGKIFDPFFQHDSSLSRQSDGTGIGLALCKYLVTYMGGHICVISTLGQGSLFRVTLPLLPVGEDIPHKNAAAVASEDMHKVNGC